MSAARLSRAVPVLPGRGWSWQVLGALPIPVAILRRQTDTAEGRPAAPPEPANQPATMTA
jgi:hypothetical protein